MKKKGKENLKKNLVYNAVYQILLIVLPLITAPYVTRVFGEDKLGIYSYTQAFAQYFLLFSMLGVNNYGNRSIARVRGDDRLVNKTFWEIYSFQLLTAIAVTSVYWICCLFVIKENRLIYFMQSFYVMSGLLDVNWCCFGLEKFKLTTVRSMTVRILTAVATFVFVKKQADLWKYTLIISLSFLLAAIAVWPFVLKNIKWEKPTWRGIKGHIKPNLVLFGPVIAISLYNIMDKLMLGQFSADAEVAFYTYAERIVSIPAMLLVAMDNVIMPRMSNLFSRENGEEAARKLMDSVMLFAMFLSSAMCFGLAGIARVFAPWFYGDSFKRCGYFIFLLCPTILLKGWAGALRTQYIIPTGRDKLYLVSLFSGAGVNLLLNLILIPKLNGVGAIIGTLAAELTVCFIQFFLCRRNIPIKSYLTDGIGFGVIGIGMYFVVAALSGISSNPIIVMAVQVAVGAALYISVACLFMVFVRKKPILVNEGLKILKIKYRF